MYVPARSQAERNEKGNRDVMLSIVFMCMFILLSWEVIKAL